MCCDCGVETARVDKVRLQVVMKSASQTRVVVAPESSADELTGASDATDARGTVRADDESGTLL